MPISSEQSQSLSRIVNRFLNLRRGVLIASPTDVTDERRVVENCVHEWNAANSRERGIILLPVRWETHSYHDIF
jgi:hypothetical protein